MNLSTQAIIGVGRPVMSKFVILLILLLLSGHL